VLINEVQLGNNLGDLFLEKRLLLLFVGHGGAVNLTLIRREIERSVNREISRDNRPENAS
jgi:hypothetical protein